VIEPSGDAMSVRAALGIINQMLAEVLDEQEGDFDPDTRWAIKWFEQHGMDRGPSGEAIDLGRAFGATLDGLERSGIARAQRGTAWLVPRDEMPSDWDPQSDKRLTIWEATQHLIRLLLAGGEESAGALLRELGGVGDTAQLLAYRLFSICERRGWAKEAGPYNALGGSWKEIQRHAQRAAARSPEQMTMGES
jgi:putative DNA methylase